MKNLKQFIFEELNLIQVLKALLQCIVVALLVIIAYELKDIIDILWKMK